MLLNSAIRVLRLITLLILILQCINSSAQQIRHSLESIGNIGWSMADRFYKPDLQAPPQDIDLAKVIYLHEFDSIVEVFRLPRALYIKDRNNRVWVTGRYDYTGADSVKNANAWNTSLQEFYPFKELLPGVEWKMIDGGQLNNLTYGLTISGDLYVWGKDVDNSFKVYKRFESYYHMYTPRKVVDTKKFKFITATGKGLLAIDTAGNLWVRGDQSYKGEFGVGVSSWNRAIDTFYKMKIHSNWKKLCHNNNLVFGIKDDGSLWTWGLNEQQNYSYFSGTGSKANAIDTPMRIGHDTDWVDVKHIYESWYTNTIFARKKNGDVYAWGMNVAKIVDVNRYSYDIIEIPQKILSGIKDIHIHKNARIGSVLFHSETDSLFLWGGISDAFHDSFTLTTSNPNLRYVKLPFDRILDLGNNGTLLGTSRIDCGKSINQSYTQSYKRGDSLIITPSNFNKIPYQATWLASVAGLPYQKIENNTHYTIAPKDTLKLYGLNLANDQQKLQLRYTYGRFNLCRDTLTYQLKSVDTARYVFFDTLISTRFDTIITQQFDTIRVNVFDTMQTQVFDTLFTTIFDTIVTSVADTLYIKATLNAQNIEQRLVFNVYPNPSRDQLHIKINAIPIDSIQINIYNDVGQLVETTNLFTDKHTWNIHNWPNGMYYLKIYHKNQPISTEKVIVIH